MKSHKEIREILEQYKNELIEKYEIKEIGIFGSYIRGEQKRWSDIDILVEFEEVPDLFKFLELERYLEEVLGRKVDLVRREALREELREIILKEVVNI
ncbi:MAG: nucleotidyltransferase family protein [Actinobacteria bacterium]|nr:nucleotidyltransferase family protein [Actinomycetota bacterium]